MDRRRFLACGAALLTAGQAQAQHHALPGAPSSTEPYARLNQGGATMDHLMPGEDAQRDTVSPAPAGPPGRWIARAHLPLPRSEMAWAAALDGRMHIVGGYGEGRVDRTYHHVYDPGSDKWLLGAPLPRGANHVAVAADAGTLYAFGGFIAQNTDPVSSAYAYSPQQDRWRDLAPLPRPRGAAAAVALGGKLHLIGGATAPKDERASVGWHEIYDPATDSWSLRKALPGARDHVGCVAHNGVIHVIGGRFNTFEYNTDLHHVYLPDLNTWETRKPLPIARSGHGLVVYRDRLFAMGGEYGMQRGGRIQNAKVFGQIESYDPATDSWMHHAPMLTPRHSVGAAAIGDWIYVAGGGAVTGGGVQSAVHEAFQL